MLRLGKDALNASRFCVEKPGYMVFQRKNNMKSAFPKEPLNNADFCDKKLKYKGFYCKNNMKPEAS